MPGGRAVRIGPARRRTAPPRGSRASGEGRLGGRLRGGWRPLARGRHGGSRKPSIWRRLLRCDRGCCQLTIGRSSTGSPTAAENTEIVVGCLCWPPDCARDAAVPAPSALLQPFCDRVGACSMHRSVVSHISRGSTDSKEITEFFIIALILL